MGTYLVSYNNGRVKFSAEVLQEQDFICNWKQWIYGKGECFYANIIEQHFKQSLLIDFFGQVLLEKLLYSCSDVKEILILMRPKRGKSESQRVADFTKLPVSKSIVM